MLLLFLAGMLAFLVFKIHSGRIPDHSPFAEDITHRHNPVRYWVDIASTVMVIAVMLFVVTFTEGW
jgi:hypothetical protein